MMLVDQLLARAAVCAPTSPAILEPAARIDYRELDRRATAVASELRAAGVRPQDRVVLAMPNSIAFVAAYFGVLRAGAVVVPLQSGPRNDRLPKVLADSAATACIVDETTWPTVAAFGGSHLRLRYLVTRSSPPLPVEAVALDALDLSRPVQEPSHSLFSDSAAVAAGDLAAIIYTSGSTGEPRGVMLSHRNIAANTQSIVEYLHLTATDRAMVVLPFYYVYGLSVLHTHIAVGGSLVVDNRFAFPNVILKSMQEHAVTGFAGVPSTFALLLHKSTVARTPLPSLRYVTQAGGAMAPARIEEWLAAVPQVPFFVMYGATEASARLTYLPPDQLQLRAGSIGRPIPNVEVRVMLDNGQVAAPGEVGELVARGANIARGYWNRPEDTAERFGPEGYRTGDLGYADADGFLYLVGRRGDMLKVGAHRVSPQEIEEALNEHPAVHEAAVVAAPHAILGEVPVAFVALRSGETLEVRDLLTFARGRLAEHKVPARITVVPEIPKTPAGKLDKRALQETVGVAP